MTVLEPAMLPVIYGRELLVIRASIDHKAPVLSLCLNNLLNSATQSKLGRL
jgi:hypothetical protein